MSLLLIAIAASLAAQDTLPVRSPRDAVNDAPAEAWTEIAPENLMVMDVNGKRVVIQLNPAFAPTHVANVKTFARSGYWDGATIYRVVDNFVAQWGDGNAAEGEEKPHPDGVVASPPPDYSRPGSEVTIAPLGSHDPFSAMAGFENGWPVALHVDGTVSPTYCYGYVGVGRNADPDTGTGAELFSIIGTPPRRLDRNYAVVGRIIEGAEYMSSLPRGAGEMSVYTDEQTPTPIHSVRMMDQLPEDERERFAMMTEGTASFTEYSYLSRTNMHYGRGVSGADICSVPVPIKSLDEEEA